MKSVLKIIFDIAGVVLLGMGVLFGLAIAAELVIPPICGWVMVGAAITVGVDIAMFAMTQDDDWLDNWGK